MNAINVRISTILNYRAESSGFAANVRCSEWKSGSFVWVSETPDGEPALLVSRIARAGWQKAKVIGGGQIRNVNLKRKDFGHLRMTDGLATPVDADTLLVSGFSGAAVINGTSAPIAWGSEPEAEPTAGNDIGAS